MSIHLLHNAYELPRAKPKAEMLDDLKKSQKVGEDLLSEMSKERASIPRRGATAEQKKRKKELDSQMNMMVGRKGPLKYFADEKRKAERS